MSIVKGRKDQRETIFGLLQDCGQHMIDNGLFQWNEQYPTMDLVEKDLENQSLYCKLINGDVAGVITLDQNQSPEYAEVDWQINGGNIGVIHRMAVSPHFQGHGVAKELMDFAEKKAIDDGINIIRLDAYSINDRAVNIYKNLGYTICGEIFFPIREMPFYCFEKRLT